MQVRPAEPSVPQRRAHVVEPGDQPVASWIETQQSRRLLRARNRDAWARRYGSVRIMVRATLGLALTLAIVACAPSGGDEGTTDPPLVEAPAGARVSAKVVGVTDGDTIRVGVGGAETPVRLIGIDTPETEGPYTDDECFGEQAARFATEFLEGREVELELDVERADRFDRTLAYVWLEGQLFNERMLLEGYAVVATFPPNVRYVDRFVEAARDARNRSAGLWGVCSTG